MSMWGAQGAGEPTTSLSPPPAPLEPFRMATPSAPILVALRVLIAVGIMLGLATLASRPAERPVSDLLEGIAAGDVSSMTIERWDPQTHGGGLLHVDWTQDGRPATSTYSYENPQGTVRVDMGEKILVAAAAAGVPVTTVSSYAPPQGATFTLGSWGLAASIAAILLLIAGGEPRMATRWAWFWVVAAIPPAWFVFLALEPLPLWATEPARFPRTRLSGGWAFLGALIVLRPLLEGTLGPQWGFLLGR